MVQTDFKTFVVSDSRLLENIYILLIIFFFRTICAIVEMHYKVFIKICTSNSVSLFTSSFFGVIKMFFKQIKAIVFEFAILSYLFFIFLKIPASYIEHMGVTSCWSGYLYICLRFKILLDKMPSCGILTERRNDIQVPNTICVVVHLMFNFKNIPKIQVILIE